MSTPPRIAAATLCAAFIITTSLGVAAPAQAASAYPTLANANVRSGPTTSSPIALVLTKGTMVTIDCYANGTFVNGTAIWNHIPAMGWISDSMLLTGSDQPVVPACSTYNRDAAVAWVHDHAKDSEKTYRFSNDCTWFVSNALWKGGLPKTADWTDFTLDLSVMADRPWPGPSKAAAAADWFKNAMVNHGFATLTELNFSDLSAGGAQLGDVILYDWDNGADGVIDHASFVTSFNTNGSVGVSQHSPARVDKDWAFDPSTGKSIGATGARAYLLHITY